MRGEGGGRTSFELHVHTFLQSYHDQHCPPPTHTHTPRAHARLSCTLTARFTEAEVKSP